MVLEVVTEPGMSYVVSGIETGYGSYHPRVVGMGSSGSVLWSC